MIDTINRKRSGQPPDNMGHDGGPDIGADQAYPEVSINALSNAGSNNISDISLKQFTPSKIKITCVNVILY